LSWAKYAHINRFCPSSDFPPAILLQEQGIRLDEFLTFDILTINKFPDYDNTSSTTRRRINERLAVGDRPDSDQGGRAA